MLIIFKCDDEGPCCLEAISLEFNHKLIMGRFTEGFCRAGHKITFKVFQKVEASKISAEQLLFHVYLSLNASNANQTL